MLIVLWSMCLLILARGLLHLALAFSNLDEQLNHAMDLVFALVSEIDEEALYVKVMSGLPFSSLQKIYAINVCPGQRIK